MKNIGCCMTKSLTLEELISALQETFADRNDRYTNICTVTEISEVKGEKRQMLILADNIKL